ncbi:SusC/RagA family TonB-linked outer membrane protein [Bacteroides congonensis]|jgi:TonB-linked SusC/RagA family outer membrane protein|uniref:SusC/RagA family TonB-linked outer membrane protein n=1 Tax=Bacteroides congonensis TaxID=1871006 RepID=UPI000337996B|nr:TonB-dependent receptor [Bacteroides congonensis]CDA86150.1 susC/RagA family TonB-linked outer membrane protein [Bacteroides sp. CAG:754]
MKKITRQVSMFLVIGALGFPATLQAKTGMEVSSPEMVQERVTGTVTDASGPVIGATVMQKGTTNGTITDMDGKFSLDGVKKGDVIQITYIGYIMQEITYTGKPIKVTLVEDSKKLDEVVVVGYATVKKANLTGAVSAVDSKVLEDRPIINLGQGLQGTIPNLNITTSGQPGKGSTYNVRGETSINGGSPLVLVDGVEMDPNLINPQDVASVSVLKDAASASIYGARAAYGVILITTKTGKKNMPTQVSLDASISFNSPTTRPSYMNSMEYANWMNAANNLTNGRDLFSADEMEHITAYFNDPANNSPVFVTTDPNSWQYGNCQAGKYAYCGNTDWMKEMYKKSYPLQQYNVNISGGSDKATYYTSVGYTDQGSLLRHGDEGFRKFNMVNNINYDINNWLNISMKTSYIRTELSGIVQDGVHGEAWIGNDTQPLMPVKHPDGNWAGQGNYTNFAAVLDEMGSRKTTKNDFWNTLALKLTPLKGMTINMDYTFNYYAEHNKNHIKSFNEYGVDGNFLQVFQYSKPNGVYEGQNNDTYNAFNFFGDYERTFGKHYFKVMAGYNQETKHTRSFYAQREKLISNDLPSMGSATGDKYVGNSDDSWATRSGFFRVNYTYADRYLLELNGRYDLSSKFPKNDRAVFNPSFSVGWKLSEESWFKNPTNGFFDELKIRGSYGSLANQALDNGWHSYLSTYGTGTMSYIMGGVQNQYVSPGGLVSTSITWEKVTQWDLGLDFAILNNRLQGTFDYYQRSTTGMLGAGKVLPGVLGTSEPEENAADMVTRGWELSLSWNDRLDNGFHYSASFNLSDTQAEITKFDNPTKSLSSSYYEGQILGDIWGYESTLFQSQAEIDAAPDQSQLDGGIKKVPGDIKFINQNGDNVINNGENTVDNPGDMKIIGNNKARFRYGFNISADWKGVDFGIFFQGVGKRDLMLPATFKWQYGSQWQVPVAAAQDYWREDNTSAYYPVARFNGGSALGQNQTRYLLNAAYLRLKSVSVGYTIPQTLTQQWGIQKCRIYFSGENLLTFKHTPEGFDPELDNPYKYPQQKSLSVGINVTF